MIEDIWKEDRALWEAAERSRVQREYAAKLEAVFKQCPGFVGAHCARSESVTSKVVVEPARVFEARVWLKRRFLVAENIDVSTDTGLVFEVATRVRKSSALGKKVVVRFGKPQQFELAL